jgi:asparagine synthase (glutamine-hydrolysing)
MFAIIASMNPAVVEAAVLRWRRRYATAAAIVRRPHCAAVITHKSGTRALVKLPFVAVASGRADKTEASMAPGHSESFLKALTALTFSGNEYRTVFDKIGPFATAMWRDDVRQLGAARDPLGLEPLFYRLAESSITVSDSIDGCDPEGTLDRAFIAQFIAKRGRVHSRTIWEDVACVLPGHQILWSEGTLRTTAYWSAARLTRLDHISLADAATQFRTLASQSIIDTMDDGGRTWAHLSGGLDSSSVVALATRLSNDAQTPRLGGTLTLRDSLGDGDESFYSDAVANQCRIQNEIIDNEWPWKRIDAPLPTTHEPGRDYPRFARDARAAMLLRRAGATSLLTGVGPDFYFPFTPSHIPELVWTRHFKEATEEFTRWVMTTNDTVWHAVWPLVIQPLMSRQCVSYLSTSQPTSFSDWLMPQFDREFEMRTATLERFTARHRNSFYLDFSEHVIREISFGLSTWWAIPGVERRHPLCGLPLVEFVLSLPRQLRTSTDVYKPVLRKALDGVLLDEVRLRTTKGGRIEPRICWAFRRERKTLERLLSRSTLADVGCLEPRRTLAVIDECAAGKRRDTGFLYAALALETWLAVRNGSFDG